MIQRILSILLLASPLILWTTLPYPHSFPRAVWIAIFAPLLCLTAVVSYKKISFVLTWIDLALVCFVSVLGLSTITSIDPALSMWGTLERSFGFSLWPILLCGYFGFRMAYKENTVPLWRAHIIITLLMSVWGIVQAIIPGFATTFSGARIGGTLGNAIFFGMYLTLSIGGIAYHLTSTRTWRWFGMITIAFAFINLILANSTGAFLGLAIGSLIAGVYYFCYTTHHKYIMVGVIITLLIGGVFFARQHKIFSATTTQTRLLNWGMAWNGFVDKPFLGWGYGMYRAAADAHFDPRLTKFSIHETHADKPHNTQLELLTTSGILGIIAYTSLLATIFISIIKLSRAKILNLPQASLLIGIFIANEIQSATAFPTNGTVIIFIFLLGELSSRSEPVMRVPHTARSTNLLLIVILTAGVASSWFGFLNPFKHVQTIGKLSSLPPTHHVESHSILSSFSTNSVYQRDAFDALSTSVVGQYWQQPTEITTLESTLRELWNSDAAALKSVMQTIATEKKEDAAWQLRLASTAFQLHAITHDTADAERAQQFIQSAHELSPRRQEPLLLLAQLELERKNYPASFIAASEAIVLDTELPIAYWYRGIALLFNKQLTDAWPDISYALSHGHKITSEQAANFIYNQFLQTGLTTEAAEFERLINQ